MNFYQVTLPVFTVAYLLQVFVIRSWVQYKKTGVNPYVFKNTDSAHDYCGKVYKLMIPGTWVSIALYSFFNAQYEYLLPFWYMEIEWLQHIGFALSIVSFIWVVIAQNQMSKSWRIGINYEEKTELVQAGIFKVSRNPIFLGVMISYVGTFLIIPNALSFAILLVTYVTLQIQIRLEEEYLRSIHGDDYMDYEKKVRRWV